MVNATSLLACALCKELLGGLKSHLAQGYFWSIILLLSMPAVLVGLITWQVVRASRQRGSH